MKTIDRFLLRSFIGPMILTFFIVMFVLMMNVMWRFIEDLVGKGLDGSVIAELILHSVVYMIPMGLPLATLFAAIMTMGNLGENYELLAMKSCGMSLPRILRPTLIVTLLISIGGFFVANNLVPYSYKQSQALRWDISQQKQTIEFKDGLFFNDIPSMSIRIEKQDKESGLLSNVLIYDNRSTQGGMSTTVADSGYIRLSDDKRYLLVTLYNGENVEQARGYKWYDESELMRNYFEEQEMIIETSGFAFNRTDADAFGSSGRAKNLIDLEKGIDSLNMVLDSTNTTTFKPFVEALFTHDRQLTKDTLTMITPKAELYDKKVELEDTISKMSLRDKRYLWSAAVSNARTARNAISFDESVSKETLAELYWHEIEVHRKIALPVSIMIFFIIGSSLGAIIRKGGLGMPIVVSVSFFVVYYVISIIGQRLALEGTWSAFAGMWLSTFILLPIAVFLLFKATNDSNLFNADWYLTRLRRLRAFTKKVIYKLKNRDNEITPERGIQ